MPRKNFSDGQEITYGDLSQVSSALELELYDRLMLELVGRQTNFCFGPSFLVSYTNSTTLSVQAGNGFYFDSTQVDPEPQHRPLYLSIAKSLTLTTADAVNNRIDIVCIAPARATTASSTRNYKSATDGSVSAQTLVNETDWSSTVTVVAGTPSASPAVPSTPAGAIKLAEVLVTAVTGVASNSAITDKRPRRIKEGLKTQTLTVAYTADLDDKLLLCNASGASFSVTLPLASTCWDASTLTGARFIIKNVGASGTVTVQPQGSDAIDGAASQTLDQQYASISIVSNGSNWFLV